MNCAAVENVLDLYEENRATPRLTAAVRFHLESCRSCRAKVTIASSPRPGTAPKEFKNRLRAALRHPNAAQAPALAMTPASWDLGAALALILFAATLALLHSLTPPILSQRPVLTDAAPWSLP